MICSGGAPVPVVQALDEVELSGDTFHDAWDFVLTAPHKELILR